MFGSVLVKAIWHSSKCVAMDSLVLSLQPKSNFQRSHNILYISYCWFVQPTGSWITIFTLMNSFLLAFKTTALKCTPPPHSIFTVPLPLAERKMRAREPKNNVLCLLVCPVWWIIVKCHGPEMLELSTFYLSILSFLKIQLKTQLWPLVC